LASHSVCLLTSFSSSLDMSDSMTEFDPYAAPDAIALSSTKTLADDGTSFNLKPYEPQSGVPVPKDGGAVAWATLAGGSVSLLSLMLLPY
jgi:hypothetical protein